MLECAFKVKQIPTSRAVKTNFLTLQIKAIYSYVNHLYEVVLRLCYNELSLKFECHFNRILAALELHNDLTWLNTIIQILLIYISKLYLKKSYSKGKKSVKKCVKEPKYCYHVHKIWFNLVLFQTVISYCNFFPYLSTLGSTCPGVYV